MKNTDLQMLACLQAFRTNSAVQTVASFSLCDWQQLYQSGCVHKLVPILYETLGQTHSFCDGDPELATLWRKSAFWEAANQARRTQRLLVLTHALDEANVTYAVVKGALCRQMYSKPDLRPSSDEDIFIPAQERNRCHEVLMQCGLTPLSVREADSVDHWLDSQTGLHIELHTRLFSCGWASEDLLNPYFEKSLAHTVAAPIEQDTVKTLPPTAHFIFLLAHALKHFIAGGFGVRTLCDILTFAQYHQTEIDHEVVYKMLSQINGRVFFEQLLAIGQAYLDFQPSVFGWHLSVQSDFEDLLEDMLAAGVYGQTSMNRRHSGALALEAVKSGQASPSVKAAIFPKLSQLSDRYPILRRAPYLLPAIWVHRMSSYGLDVLRSRGKGNSPQKAISLGKQRTEMMVKYGIIPENKTKN